MVAKAQQEWVGASEAERIAGCSRRTLSRLSQAGVVERRREDGRPWEYRRSDLEAQAEGREVEPDQEMMLGQAYGVIRDLTTPAKAFCQLLSETNRELRARCAFLEQRHDELIRAREDLLNQKTERRLAAKYAETVEDRKERAFKLIETKVAPKLIEGIKGKGSAGKLMASLTQEQIELLLNTDLINDEQKSLFKGLLQSSGVELLDDGKDTNAA